VPFRATLMPRSARGGRQVPRKSEKGVMKLSGISSGAVVLLPFTVVAQAQGAGDAQRGAAGIRSMQGLP
jgi:hypothetical protein